MQIDLTLKEALEAGARPRKRDYRDGWKPGLMLRTVAALQHWYLTHIRSRPEIDLNRMYAAPIARQAPPSCTACGAPLGSCAHSGGPLRSR